MENFQSSKCVRGLEFRFISMPCYVLFQNSEVIFWFPGLLHYSAATMPTEHAVTPTDFIKGIDYGQQVKE